MKTKDLPNGDPVAAPGAATSVTPEPTEPEGDRVPHGAQTLADIYQALEMACTVIDKEQPALDNETVKKFLEKLTPDIEKVMTGIAEAFAKQCAGDGKISE